MIFDSCTCTDELLFMCEACGYCDASSEGRCRDCDGWVKELSTQQLIIDHPERHCPQHGWCAGDCVKGCPA